MSLRLRGVYLVGLRWPFYLWYILHGPVLAKVCVKMEKFCKAHYYIIQMCSCFTPIRRPRRARSPITPVEQPCYGAHFQNTVTPSGVPVAFVAFCTICAICVLLKAVSVFAAQLFPGFGT